MTLADRLAAGSAAIAGIGLVFTGAQLWLLNRQARYERRISYDGVVVTWHPIEAPHRPWTDGNARWTYEITVNNPGRLPIDHIDVRWVFPCPVRRLHSSGILDEPSPKLTLVTPVLAGGGARSWTRQVQMPFDNRHLLAETYAEVTYVDIDGKPHRNRWPRIA
ncbi:hypothetical protein [Dactylosporangium sp. NPDC051541]|uniref:hypothetical protein n=1 Tax=Dactylosporangium sp. NPDC051541 TaxID=3363977 RepID=UPI00379BFFEF